MSISSIRPTYTIKEAVALRRRYVGLKIGYWQALQAGDKARAELLSDEARTLANDLKRTKKH